MLTSGGVVRHEGVVYRVIATREDRRMTSGDDENLGQSLARAMSELIALIQEAKQALWAGPRGELHDQIEEFSKWLVAQVDDINRVEQQLGGRAADFIYPSARTRPNLLAAAGDRPEVIVTLLAADIGAVVADLRRAARGFRDPITSAPFVDVADELEVRRASLLALDEGSA